MTRWLAVVAFPMLASPLFAAVVFPPTVDKSFSPSTVGVNQISILTITLTNPNTTALTGASLNDTFPAGLVNAFPSGPAATTCGSGSAFAATNQISLSGGIIPANGSCTITASVLSSTPGVYTNSTGHLFSTGPPSLTTGTATLTVLSSVPALSPALLAALAIAFAALGAARLKWT